MAENPVVSEDSPQAIPEDIPEAIPEEISQDGGDVVLEANQRLSRSHLWTLQRQFFEQQGIQAWSTNQVPHYITSNPFIARAYGKVVSGFLRDWLAAIQCRVGPAHHHLCWSSQLGWASPTLRFYWHGFCWVTLALHPAYILTGLVPPYEVAILNLDIALSIRIVGYNTGKVGCQLG